MKRTPATTRIFGDWNPGIWVPQEPSEMKHDAREDLRCSRCGVWPDQYTGIRGDWLISPMRLCPGCYDRIEFRSVRDGVTLEEAATRWPRRGFRKRTDRR
jgi:hypothetical protein